MTYYPPVNPAGPSGTPPPNHLVWAILTTLFCCLPAGIVSIVFAAQVNSKWSSGDHAGAVSASNNAKIWAIVSAVIGGVATLLFVALSAGNYNG
ncbi:CD225/dispanin family protein [Actinomadura litoris]|uniref:CD225/dispanin family protein n=1 Tax=Actinomadura litoris TaxID=2678616 RepID=UPI001FA6E5AE|nr:CD225/dispanin family protein [Actinomadura litoris]